MLFPSHLAQRPTHRLLRLLFSLSILVSTLAGALVRSQPAQAADASALPPVLDGDDRWGFNHVPPSASSAQLARNAGARWNRWEFRWDAIQPQPGPLSWTESDRALNDSLDAGLAVQAVLIGLPN